MEAPRRERHVAAPPLVHEDTYRGVSPVHWVHRLRLNRVLGVLARHGRGAASWADVGCSNGFVVARALARGVVRPARIVGFDHSEGLLALARGRGLPGVEFRRVNVCSEPPDPERFELVTCLETLEHVADWRAALRHLVARVAPGGLLVLTMPNELGAPGLVKLAARPLVRRRPYAGFFRRVSPWRYAVRVATGGEIESFRAPGSAGYGPHLGFDWRRVVAHVDAAYVKPGRLVGVERRFTPLRMNVVAVYRATRSGRTT